MKLPHQWGKRTKGIDIPKCLKKLNIFVLDFDNKPTKPPQKKRNGTNLRNVGGSERKIPQDIALSILFQSTDFSALKNLILVNKCFLNAFQSYRISVIDAVVLNMFGAETADYAIALARFINNPPSVLSEDGTIVLTTRGKTLLPSGTIKKAQSVYLVVMKWVGLYEIKGKWLDVPRTKGQATASYMNTQKLSPTERTRFCHALVIYWIYAFCVNHINKQHPYPFSMDGMQKSGLCGYFSNFELVGLMAICSFSGEVPREACDDCQSSGDNGFRMYFLNAHKVLLVIAENNDVVYQQGACLAHGPVWVLRSLYFYHMVYSSFDGRQREAFALYDMTGEGERRKVGIGYGDEAVLTDTGHQAWAKEWQSQGIDGNFRRSKMLDHAASS